MAATTAEIFISNDTLITVTGLQNAVDSSYLNAATVTATIKDATGTAVTGETFPLTLSYVAASNGNYRGTVDKSLAITDGNVYFVEITAAEGGLDAFWRIPALAKYRVD